MRMVRGRLSSPKKPESAISSNDRCGELAMTDEMKVIIGLLLIAVVSCVLIRTGALHALLRKPSARCRDGSFSFSEHRCGSCSHHGGVAEFLPV